MADQREFVPLRTDPPPTLATTLWLRSALALCILATAVVSLLADVGGGALPAPPAPAIVVAHLAVTGLLVAWSGRTMANIGAMLPPTRYAPVAAGARAGALWVGAVLASALAVGVLDRIGDGDDPDATAPTVLAIAVVVVTLLAAWAPFRYHARHTARLGVPRARISLWFWAPLATFVVGVVALAFVYRERFGTGEPVTGTVGVGGIYGLALGVFAWSTWRAVTVIDEVIDLRWERWRVEWERTLADMLSQPEPPPDG